MTYTHTYSILTALVILFAAALLLPAFAFAAHEGKTDGFVCPVIKTDAVLNSPKGGALGDTGDYTIGGPDVSVPIHATNDEGAGEPAGDHAGPGDTTYTAIWNKQ